MYQVYVCAFALKTNKQKKNNYYLMWLFWVLVVACELSCSVNVGSSYWVRDWTWAPCKSPSTESHPLDHQRSPCYCFLLLYLYLLYREQKHSRICFCLYSYMEIINKQFNFSFERHKNGNWVSLCRLSEMFWKTLIYQPRILWQEEELKFLLVQLIIF